MTAIRDQALSLDRVFAERLSDLKTRMDSALALGRLAELIALSADMVRLYDSRLMLLDAARGLDEAESRVADVEAKVYKLGTRFLRQCYEYLLVGSNVNSKTTAMYPFGKEQETESIHAVTGIREQETVVLSEIIPLEASKRSSVTVEVDVSSLGAVLREIQDSGHVLWAIFHSHRMSGPPQPSAVDMQLQRKLEAGGYKAIQAVFSDDGHVRFFAAERSFQIAIYGKGVEQLDDRLFRILGI